MRRLHKFKTNFQVNHFLIERYLETFFQKSARDNCEILNFLYILFLMCFTCSYE